jgi:penicillin-binding protein 2
MRYGHRLALLLSVTTVGFAVVWGRTFQLQVLDRPHWAAQADRTRNRVARIEAPRGRILDASGEVLAEDRPVVQLAFVAGEWETRTRWRCRTCGHAQFRRDPEAPRRAGMRASEAAVPSRCSCGARGTASFDRLPDEDLAPLERELGLEHGALKAFASQRTAELERTVERHVARLSRGGAAEATARDLRSLVRQDHFARPTTIPVVELPGRDPVAIRDLSEAAIRRLELDADGRYRGFRAVTGVERRYPKGPLLAQVLGFTSGIQQEDLEASGGRLGRDVTWTTRVGRAGLERFYDAALRGTPGRLRWVPDEDGDLVPRAETPARPGLEVRLGLSAAACAEAQRILESVATAEGYGAHGPASGGLVAIDAETGEVLAWAEVPVFDLDGDLREVVRFADGTEARPGGAEPDAVTPRDVTPNATLSRVAQIGVEPGSAMKVPTALCLMELGVPLPRDYACIGISRSDTDKPGCHDHPMHGYLGVEDALCVSCNRWFAHAVSRAGAHALCLEGMPPLMTRLGFGRSPEVDLPRPAAGWYRVPKKHPTLRNLAIGQGDIAVTPLQMARLMALVANGGRLPVPRLAVRVGGTERKAAAEQVALAPESLARVRAGMRAVVGVPGGTARRAFAEVSLPAGVEVAGKTGTAQVPNGGDFDPGRIADGPWHHWFVGYARQAGEPRTIAFATVLYARREAAAGETVARATARFLRWWFDGTASR